MKSLSFGLMLVSVMLGIVAGFAPTTSTIRPVALTESSMALDMKVRNSLKSLKKLPGSRIVRRRGVTYVINKSNPKIKCRQGGLSKKKKKK